MKWFFFLLLLMNIGLFVWIYPQAPVPRPEVFQTPGVKQLVLLRETAQQPAVVPASKLQPAAPADEVELPPLAESAEVAQAPGPAPASDIPALPIMPSAQQARSAGPADTPPAGPAPTQQQEKTAAKPARQCARIGPLTKREQADRLSLRLVSWGIQADLQTEQTDDQDGYWVLIPKQRSKEAAVEIVARLRRAGVSDLWRFTSGSLEHAISLGLFRTKSRAEIRRKEIVEKGFDAQVSPRYRQQTGYWLVFGAAGEEPLAAQKWQAIVSDFPGIERFTVDCPVSDR